MKVKSQFHSLQARNQVLQRILVQFDQYSKRSIFFQNLQMPQFKVGEVGLKVSNPAQTIRNYRRDEMLAPRVQNDNSLTWTWNDFSFSEYVWINLITDLRSFGLSSTRIRKVRKFLTESYPTEELFSNHPSKDGFVPQSLSILDILIADIVLNRDLVHVVMDQEDHVNVVYYRFDENAPDNDEPLILANFNSFLTISLNQILARFIASNNPETSFNKVRILNKAEYELWSQVCQDEINKLKIYGEAPVEEREFDFKGKASSVKKDAFMQVLLLERYSRIDYENIDGVRITINNRSK